MLMEIMLSDSFLKLSLEKLEEEISKAAGEALEIMGLRKLQNCYVAVLSTKSDHKSCYRITIIDQHGRFKEVTIDKIPR